MAVRNRTRRVTLDDVARAAGVSRATVSRVINSSKPVAPEVAHAVRQALDDLGYVPNLMARSLMTRRSDMVALVSAEPDVRIFNDPFFAGITRGVSLELSDADLRLILLMIQRPADAERIEEYLLSGHADGVLVISEHASQKLVGRLATAGIPVVVGGRPADSSLALPFVDNDNVVGARLAVEHLGRRGCRRIATVAGPTDMTAGVDRLQGFVEGLGGRVAPELIVRGDFTVASGVAATEQLLATDPTIDAIFAASDLMALGALQVLRREGRRVPEDVAVVGFDDIDLARVSTPPLTTVRQDTVAQGQMMVRLLLQLLGRTNDLPRATRRLTAGKTSILLPVELVLRASA